jgi:hypothetical protein
LFVVPHAADRNFFYGINFEFAYGTPPFAQSLTAGFFFSEMVRQCHS